MRADASRCRESCCVRDRRARVFVVRKVWNLAAAEGSRGQQRTAEGLRRQTREGREQEGTVGQRDSERVRERAKEQRGGNSKLGMPGSLDF